MPKPTKIERLFSTLVYQGELSQGAKLNRELLCEIHHFSRRDAMGRAWSKENYKGGYTSYGSLSDMHYRSPAFSELASLLQSHALAFAEAQAWDLRGLKLEMTACWINIMPRHTYHGLHLHPHSVISGTYYVSAPSQCAALKLEDPRLGFYMNAPVRRESADAQKLFHEIKARAGAFVLFDSWLRHEVPPNLSKEPRISISFNYSLEPIEE